MSAMTTLDILANYTRLPMTTFEDLQDHLDDPSNGMMLEMGAHKAYDHFFWCLKPTLDVSNTGALIFLIYVNDNVSRKMCML